MGEKTCIPIKIGSVVPRRTVIFDPENGMASIHCIACEDVVIRSIDIPLQHGWEEQTGLTVENLIEVALMELEYQAKKDANGKILPGDEAVDHLKSALAIAVERAKRRMV